NIVLPIGAGLLIGFLIGLTGMGGGALMTPFLLLVMKLNPVAAIGTDLAFAAITKVVGGAQHYRHGNASLRQVAWMALGSLPASFFSAQLVLQLPTHLVQDILPNILGGVLILIGLIIMSQAVGLLKPRESEQLVWPRPFAMIAIGAIGGFLVGLTSIGGGTVIMAMLIIFFTIPLNYLVGLDVLHGALLATVAASTYAMSGQTDWSLVGWLLIGSLPGAWLGAHAIKRLNRQLVRTVLALLILGAGLNLLISH
ncbi:MAG: sulfite exporter TauE/SafE family protein, partial [Anaerolineales bacterium]|nr:sulfite exporter TauE/SafE family protein [Anaerolineales bacterium]